MSGTGIGFVPNHSVGCGGRTEPSRKLRYIKSACLADRRGLGTTAVFGISQRLLPLTMCGNPNPDASFDRGCWSKMGPHFRLEAVPKMKTEKFSRKNHQFRVHKIDDWFCGPKTFIFGSQSCSIRDGLRPTMMGSENKKGFFKTLVDFFFRGR